jgi:dolichol kinase
MLPMLFAVAGTAVILLASEYLCQKRILKGEFARKFVHIITATFAAFWPLFLSFPQIAILSVLFVVVLVIVKKLNLFTSLKSARRATYGEIWYAVGIGASALIFQDAAVYAIAVLHMALADGFAAVVGVAAKKKTTIFKFNGHTKTIIGSTTFFVISYALNLVYWFALEGSVLNSGGMSVMTPIIFSIVSSTLLTLVEIISPKGSDNVIVPLLAGSLLVIFQTLI